ncbi:MAG TPA: CCA tRNA nucleotidyltransferase [Clostridia bacterium]|nr:hypothetical protein [Clostridia bacterium]HHY06082.1 CCA tRNA nucleotidyltransferase [Clostridia bacterium]
MSSVNLPENLIIAWLRQEKREKPLFLVGGSVRDFLLQREFKDYDFLLEGDCFLFVSRLKEQFGGKAVFNQRLLTATYKIKGLVFDFATARKEHYARPGILPQVRPTTWQEDLKRRDFTINTLVIPLLKEGWGKVINLLGGKEDLEHRLIRILHKQSFYDDPTRILRAIRYRNRFSFSLEKKTLQYLEQSWPYLQNVSPRRRFKEWQLLCAEEEVVKNIEDIFVLGGWSYFMGGLSFQQSLWEKENRAIAKDSFPKELRPWYLYLLIFLAREPEMLEQISAYWGLYPQEKKGLKQTLILLAKQNQFKRLKWRQLLTELKELPPEGTYYLFRQNPNWGENWESFYQEILANKMPLQGKDLFELGLKPGPEMGRLLRCLEKYYQEDLFQTPQEGLKLAKRLIKEDFNE